MENVTAPNWQPESQLFRDVFDASPIGIAVEDIDGQPLFVNPALCSMLGFSEEELRRKHCVEFSPAEDAEKDWALFQKLRAGSIDHYQLEKRYFRRDGSLFWARLSLSRLNSRPSPLLIAMVEDIADKKAAQENLELERKRSQESLRESEERLRLAVQARRMFAYSWDAQNDMIERSGESAAILGIEKAEASTGGAIAAMVHPEDRLKLGEALAKLTIDNPDLQITYRILRRDGTVAWLERNSRAYFDADGKLLRMVGMIADISERKLAEEKLADMTRKLMEAQELERARIGRELHDDINQRLAMLVFEIEELQHNPSDTRSRLHEVRKRLTEISNDVQALSHNLQLTKLEYLGVVPAIRSWCREFAERQRTKIEFRAGVYSAVPLEVGRSLLRLVQEAVHNAVKHSGTAREVAVQLWEQSAEIHLMVQDSGIGFDVEAALQGKGLGLSSMRERIRLLNGTIRIDSQPMQGTTIHARVPLDWEMQSQRQAG